MFRWMNEFPVVGSLCLRTDFWNRHGQTLQLTRKKFMKFMFIKYVKKHENRLYIYKYNWKDLKELLPSDSWLIL